MNWVPLWNDILESRKVQKLPGDAFKAWINLLCLAARRDADGTLPPLEDIAFALRIDEEKAREYIESLATCGLIDRIDGGFVIHDWEDWQLKSYNSTERVRKHRERERERQRQQAENGHETGRNGGGTPGNNGETFQKRSRNDPEQEQETEGEGERSSRPHANTHSREGEDLEHWREAISELQGSGEGKLIAAMLQESATVPSVARLEAWRFVHAAHRMNNPKNPKTWEYFLGTARRCSRREFDAWHDSARAEPTRKLPIYRAPAEFDFPGPKKGTKTS